MGVRIPQNQIVESKYTVGNEYMFESTYKEYQGYYYELNGNLFAGKEFNINAPILIKIISSNTNRMLMNPDTYVYAKVSGAQLHNTIVLSHIDQGTSNIRYFSYQITTKLIKEINADTYNSLKSNPIYKTVALPCNNNGGFNDTDLQYAEKIIPGITTFINTSYINPPIEEDGSIG